MITHLWTTSTREGLLQGSALPTSAVEQHLTGLAAELLSCTSDEIEHDRNELTLGAGDTITLGPQTAAIHAVFYSKMTATDMSDPLVGATLLHDPRAAAIMVSMPGLPWGRPVVTKARPKAYVVFPGWLSWSVLPVATGQVIDLEIYAFNYRYPARRSTSENREAYEG